MNDQYGVSPSYEKKITWGFLLTETYRIYSQRFWTLFRIGLPIAAHTDQGLGILVAALAVYICIAAALESPIFIMFSVLHRELKAKPAEAMTAPAIG